MKSYLVKKDLTVWRILNSVNDEVLVIDCFHKTMPVLKPDADFKDAETVDESELPAIRSMDDLSPGERKTAINRYTTIASVLTVLSDTKKRNLAITQAANQWKISKQTLRSYLYKYLIHQDIAALAPKEKQEKELTPDEKNFRWALNKFFKILIILNLNINMLDKFILYLHAKQLLTSPLFSLLVGLKCLVAKWWQNGGTMVAKIQKCRHFCKSLQQIMI